MTQLPKTFNESVNFLINSNIDVVVGMVFGFIVVVIIIIAIWLFGRSSQ
jgi:uncharacterized membrane protein required for colicin V production